MIACRRFIFFLYARKRVNKCVKLRKKPECVKQLMFPLIISLFINLLFFVVKMADTGCKSENIFFKIILKMKNFLHKFRKEDVPFKKIKWLINENVTRGHGKISNLNT